MREAFLGLDIGSISTKGVIIDGDNNILSQAYIWTEGNPIKAARTLLKILEKNLAADWQITAVGVTGSARRLIGAITEATLIKNEITAHAIGAIALYPQARTVIEIGGQDSKIILLENGVVTDYAMNTLCAAGTGAFLSSQAQRLGIRVEDFGRLSLKSQNPTPIAARCTVFAESDLVHKAQAGYGMEDIIAGLCKAVTANYLNNVGKGKKILPPVIFQGGVSKNTGVVKAFEEALNLPLTVYPQGHLAGAFGMAVMAGKKNMPKLWSFALSDADFSAKGALCGRCPNNCEIIRVYKEGKIIDAWGNRCEKGGSLTAAGG
jgi:predicted CoA-substrate-specific enzyme activase